MTGGLSLARHSAPAEKLGGPQQRQIWRWLGVHLLMTSQ
ncbi:hypothetical protein HACA111877_09780 [Halomonas casei]